MQPNSNVALSKAFNMSNLPDDLVFEPMAAQRPSSSSRFNARASRPRRRAPTPRDPREPFECRDAKSIGDRRLNGRPDPTNETAAGRRLKEERSVLRRQAGQRDGTES